MSLMTLPNYYPARASLKSVPPSIREGALAVGASKVQTVFHHVVHKCRDSIWNNYWPCSSIGDSSFIINWNGSFCG